jgi:predicted DNA-binding ribbon-helix-helix protein
MEVTLALPPRIPSQPGRRKAYGVRTTISLDKITYDSLTEMAAARQTSIGSIIREAILEFLGNTKATKKPTRHNK